MQRFAAESRRGPRQRVGAPTPNQSMSNTFSLLPTSHLRSDDPEAGNLDSDAGDPDARAGKPHVHRITGEFADPRLTAEFGPQVFRSMFPLHAAGLGLVCVGGVAFTVSELDTPMAARLDALGVVLCALGLWARVAVHQWEDTKKAQSFGALAWTIIVGAVNFLMLISAALATENYCSTLDSLATIIANPLIAVCFAVVNATHGMEFWHATSLVGLMLGGYTAEAIACGSKPATILAIAELVLMAVGAHFAHLIARHSFMRSYYTQESRDRLDFRDQMASHRERRAGARPAVLRETGHSDHSSASAPTAAPAASTTSAPAAVRFAPGTRGGTGTTQPSTVAPEAQPSGPGGAGPSGHSGEVPVMLEPWPVQAEAGPSTSADNGLPHRPDEYLLHRPMFSLTLDEFHRQAQLTAQRDAERLQQEHDDQASDAMSQDGGAPPPQGVPHEWSTTASSTSTRTRNMTRRQKQIEKLRQGKIVRPSEDQVRRNPYI